MLAVAGEIALQAPIMGQNKLNEIAVYRRKLAVLEKELQSFNRKLLALPAKFGFKSVEQLVDALRTAAGGKATVKVPAPAKGEKKRKARAVITPELKQKLKAMVEADKTGDQIAKALGISVPSVHNIKKELGLVKARKK